ncbi:MAG: DUF2235 domain-containing protein, partial [Nocardioidaceae bacterium]
MKRLILCCDGTWNAADSAEVSNISKLALAIETREPVPARPRAPGDDTHQGPWDEPVLQQVVHYITGVGSRGYLADRILGGAFGYGFTSNVNEGYRVLCMNYDDGDEIYLFGFSRGAYTARSIGGMVSSIGLLTPQALLGHQDGNKLDEAERLYRDRRPGYKKRRAEFRRASCRDGVRIEFLGVFDTVGALGVPGPARRRNQFHDVRLPDTVQCARQALAIDERRMTFEPCVWTVPDPPGRTPEQARGSAVPPRERVRQVWFEGVHSDVGGGYPDSALSDTALSWMVHE